VKKKVERGVTNEGGAHRMLGGKGRPSSFPVPTRQKGNDNKGDKEMFRILHNGK